MISVYTLMSKEIKEFDVPMEKEEYSLLTDKELDEKESADPQFLRANSKQRAMRFVDEMRRVESYWWNFRDDGSQMFDADIDAVEEKYMNDQAAFKNANGGLAGAGLGKGPSRQTTAGGFGAFGGAPQKKKFCQGGGAFGIM